MSDRITPHLSRRHFLAGLTATAGAAILAACGGETPAATPTTGATVATTAPATTGSTPTTAPAMATRASSPAAPTVMTGATTAANNAPGMMQSNVVPTPPANVPKGGTLTRALVGTDAKSFHPYLTSDVVSTAYQGNVFGGGLIEYDPDTLDLRPSAAEKFEVSPDKKTYTFTLRDNLKWSDGKQITTDDYVWTFGQIKKPENKYPYLDNLKEIVSYTAKDPRTLVVTLTEALVTGLSDADAVNVPLPRHIWEKYDWADAAKNPEINAPTVTSGPFKLKEWKRDSQATFVANDLYWEGRPNIDTWVYRVFGNQTLAYQALKSGEVDYSGFQTSDYREAKTLANITVPEWYAANGRWSYIGLNLRRPALKDPLVRKAISHATDRQGLIEGVLFGLGRPLSSPFPQSSWATTNNVEKYAFDPKKATDLFRQAGYMLQGNRLMKDGQQLTLKALYATGSKTTENIVAVIQQQMGDLGVKLDAQALEFQALLEATKTEPFDWDLFFGGWSATIEPYYMYQIWAESNIPALNRGGYVNKEVEKLFDQSAREFDREKRKVIFADIQKRITDDAPYVFLYEDRSYVGINKRVQGISIGPTGPYDNHKWYITGNR